MKKNLLIAGILFSSMAIAQNPNGATPAEELKKSDSKRIVADGPLFNDGTNQEFHRYQLKKARQDVYTFDTVGENYYDLQSNYSVGRRLLLHGDGTISTVWTHSPDQNNGFPNRGTGINYYDGSNWGAYPTGRTENARTGWPSIMELSDGSVTTFGHVAGAGWFIQATAASKGSTSWTSSSTQLSHSSGGAPIWNRSASNGDTIHLISNFNSNADASPPIPMFYLNGVEDPTTYSRSFDGGKTWVDEHIALPGYDSTRYVDGQADSYAIDVEGSTVAIVIGGMLKDLSLWKSTDNGETWTYSVPMPFPVGGYEWGKAILPQDSNYIHNDGSLDVLIDNNGNVHIVTGLLGVYDEDTTDESIFLPNYFSCFHWSENSPTWKAAGGPIDMDLSTTFDFADETMNRLGTDGYPMNNLAYAARYGNASISTHPSLSKDSKGNVFLTYDAPVEAILHDFGANFRDVHITYSTDGGANWAAAQNASQLRNREAVFASQSRIADDFVHFIFQEDAHPGTFLQNNGNSGTHPNEINMMHYAAIPTADILADLLGQNNLSTKPIEKDAKIFVVSQNYPNPFSGSSTVKIYMRAGSDLGLTVTDILGKEVLNQELGYKGAGNHEIEIDASKLTSGIYFYTLKSKDFEVTKKMKVVQ